MDVLLGHWDYMERFSFFLAIIFKFRRLEFVGDRFLNKIVVSVSLSSPFPLTSQGASTSLVGLGPQEALPVDCGTFPP